MQELTGIPEFWSLGFRCRKASVLLSQLVEPALKPRSFCKDGLGVSTQSTGDAIDVSA